MKTSHRSALRWLAEHGGSGTWGKGRGQSNVLLAAGEWASYMRETWNTLCADGYVENKDGRVSLTDKGREAIR